MSKYIKCPNCGAHLDSGEVCDCEEGDDRNPRARYERCKDCGRKWNVSRQLRIPWYGYRCPTCTGKLKR